ncbi:hypothetical protein GCM10022225_25490 [Plantactinospora mayteni]|uniref:Twin-arginine translocation signal domain-containing protein n=1 Tax=Plantactinospora mayteni TaxID=566021 RepID=A0ABQ4EJ14_9ACTN|nr:bacteriocin fulvocin C-related protein [Plantactinospora mayteni]GIG94721.1 hypothetical protein Pma05_12940 [Plantactinospora mayteni]
MSGEQTWILAFDGSCATCRAVSTIVARECGDVLTVKSLGDGDVIRWRSSALGAGAPSAPTLLRVRGDRVAAWTGIRMGVRLAKRVGPRSALRILRNLGEVKNREAQARTGMARKDFLKLAAGAGIAMSILGFNRSPAFGDGAHSSPAEQWVNANLGSLPTDYDKLSAFDPTYRRAIYRALPPPSRKELWVEHLSRHRAEMTSMSADQRRVIDRAIALSNDEQTFVTPISDEQHAVLEEIREAAIAAFGLERARSILAQLGTSTPATSPASADGSASNCGVGVPDCNCSCVSDYCAGRFCLCCGACNNCGTYCCCSDSGCGSLWLYACTGKCP